MCYWLRRILCGLSLLLVVVTVGSWLDVAFYADQWFTWQGQGEYSLVLDRYGYRLDILHCEQQVFEVHGDLAMARAGTAVAVPMRGVEHFADARHGQWFRFDYVDGWPATNAAWPLPAPVALAGGGELRTELRVSGVSLGVPYWFVIVAGALLPPSCMASWTAALYMRARRRRLMEKRLCVS